MPTTTGMKPGGFYDANSSAQRVALDAFLPWLEEACGSLALPPSGRPIGLLDLGTSEGANAIYAMRRLVAALRQRTEAPLWLFFNDLPTNDFNQLFANLYPAGIPALTDDNSFAAAVGSSAFGRVVPASSIQIATTYNAIGFLERLPDQPLPNFILPMPPGPGADGASVSEAEQAPFRQQADADLRAFYRARATELTSGGQLMVQVFGRDGAISTSHGIYDVLNDALRDLVESGDLSEDFYRKMRFPVYFRDLAELLAPLRTETGLQAAFAIERGEAKEIAVPFNEQYERDGDRQAWASRYTGFLRAFTEPVLAPELARAQLPSSLADALYGRISERLQANPQRYRFRYIALGALLRRR